MFIDILCISISKIGIISFSFWQVALAMTRPRNFVNMQKISNICHTSMFQCKMLIVKRKQTRVGFIFVIVNIFLENSTIALCSDHAEVQIWLDICKKSSIGLFKVNGSLLADPVLGGPPPNHKRNNLLLLAVIVFIALCVTSPKS